MYEWRLHDCTCVSEGYMTTCVWRLHDCTCTSGGYMTVHICMTVCIGVGKLILVDYAIIGD